MNHMKIELYKDWLIHRNNWIGSSECKALGEFLNTLKRFNIMTEDERNSIYNATRDGYAYLKLPSL